MPHHERWEAAGRRRPRGVARRRAGRPARVLRRRGVRRRRAWTTAATTAVLTEELARAGATGPAFGAAQRHHRPVPHRPDHRRAEAALAARVLHRRDHHRDRDDRAGRRQRPAGHPHHRGPRRRRATSSMDRRRSSATASWPTSSSWWPAPTRTPGTAASACSWSSAAWPGFERGRNLEKIGQKAQDTAELFFADVRVPAANLLGEEGAGLPLPDAQPAGRAAVDRGRRDGRGREGVRADAASTARTARGVRPADRLVPAQPVRARRDGHRAANSGRTFVDRCLVEPDLDAPRRPRWRSGGAPSCRSGSSTGACSCTAATAT